MQSNKFINIKDGDFWTALRDGTAIISRTKPKPYKDFRRLTNEEDAIYGCRDQTLILLTASAPTHEERHALLVKSMANFICEDYPDLAKKHNLTIDRVHEYWRK